MAYKGSTLLAGGITYSVKDNEEIFALADSHMINVTKDGADKRLDTVIAEEEANIAPRFSDSVEYKAKNIVQAANGKLYRCKTDIAAGAWDASKWEEVSIADAFYDEAYLRDTQHDTMGQALAAEQEARIQAVADEATARINADNTLSNKYDSLDEQVQALAAEGPAVLIDDSELINARIPYDNAKGFTSVGENIRNISKNAIRVNGEPVDMPIPGQPTITAMDINMDGTGEIEIPTMDDFSQISGDIEGIQREIDYAKKYDDNVEYNSLHDAIEAARNSGGATEEQIAALKEDLANYTPLTNKKVLKYGDYSLKTGRVTKNGSIQTLSGFSYVTLDVENIKSITMQINVSGSSDLGYCFYNADGSVNLFKGTNYTKIETIEVPQGATVFRYGQGDSLWSNVEIVLETNEDKTYEILYNKLLNSESKIGDINNQQGNFYKKEMSKKLSKDSDEVIETKDKILLADGTPSWTGVSGRNIYTVNNIEDYLTIAFKTVNVSGYGSNASSYAWLGSDGVVLKAVRCLSNEIVTVPIFENAKSIVIYSTDDFSDGCILTSKDDLADVKNSVDKTSQRLSEIEKYNMYFYKKEISKTLSKDSDEVIETQGRVLLADGTPSWTGVSGRNIYTVNNLAEGSSITFKTVNVSGYGSNASSYAWLGSDGVVLKAVRCLSDEIVTVPIWEDAKSIVIYSTNDFSDGCILTSKDDLADVKNSVDKTSQRLSEIEKYNMYIDENPLGYMDNLFIDKWNGIGTFKSDGGAIKNIITKTYDENDVLVGFKVIIGYSTSINDVVRKQGTSYFRIKKSTSDRTIHITLESGAVCNFKDYDIEEGTVLYQKYATNPIQFGEIVKVTDDYVIFYTNCINAYTITSKTETTNPELVIYPEYCGAFLDLVAKKNINFDMKYKSRSMKINSPVRGKNAICFGDSLAAWTLPLAEDYGMNVFTVTGGGCRMGYEGGSGAGGETGTSDTLWLCSDTRIQRFNEHFADLKNVDYIINMTGTNGTLSDISNAEELKFISKNKRWWFDTSETNPFDGLSDENKARFTSQACYLMSFIKLIQRFPRAIPVVCSLYRYRNADNRTENEVINYLYYDERGQKNEVLKQISDCLGGYYVDLEKCGCNVMSDGGDSVHPDYRHAIMTSSEIVKTIEHLDYVGDKFN